MTARLSMSGGRGNALPSQASLARLLRYEPETGKLFWLERTPGLFADGAHSAAHTCAIWNSRHAGKEALAARHGQGYRHGAIGPLSVLAHRIIWKLVTGDEPVEIDHIDGNRANNRWSNLRSVSSAANRKNVARHADNRSGVTGVRKSRDKWQAFITSDYRMKCLGTFGSFGDAVAARKAAERRHDFHPNHGRAAA